MIKIKMKSKGVTKMVQIEPLPPETRRTLILLRDNANKLVEDKTLWGGRRRPRSVKRTKG